MKGNVAKAVTGQSSGTLQVPAYFLFGEPREVPLYGFLHAEPLDVRNAANQWNIPPHFHPDFDQLSILFTGSSDFEHDGIRGAVGASSCVFTKAGMVHQFSYEPDAEGVVISVSPDFADGLAAIDSAARASYARLTAVRTIAVADARAMQAVRQQCEQLCHHVAAYHPHRRDLLRHTFAALLLELDPFACGPPVAQAQMRCDPTAIDLFERYQELMRREIGRLGVVDESQPAMPTVERFAADLATTPYALNVACNTIAGTGARALLQSAMIYQASRLLLFTRRPVKEISYLLGYSHASHFVRFFKQQRNATPDAFRRNHGAG